ncbi:SIMPL domain-containing protein [Acidiphilium sp. AL]|uniref:SIMPL domain-containing protein n=1 Tax=Acidiphilium iwatense TaxID=768198 RepID=A0ABS9DZ81_9PROT|nr:MULTISPECIES: SIMPL domain-containing protein [Acidiphilium]MCF3948066.1 SIMPL domain-containing protein [Acidiphilium iwatense]MCU4162062.1 SIMPL domain-containing protein [Acidiphilium sp. AL]
MKKTSTRIAVGATLWLTGAFIAHANPTPHGSSATTIELEVTGSADHVPDAMLVRLSATASAPTAADAQRRINVTMAEALREAVRIKGLMATTDGYSVVPDNAKHTAWRAQQGLTLRFDAAPDSAAAKPVLALIGRLQTKNMLLEGLSGTLSPSVTRQTRDAAIGDAVAQLRSETAAAAKALGEQPGQITHLRLNIASPIRPFMRALPMMAAAAPAPSAQPGPIRQEVSLSATILLEPPSR